MNDKDREKLARMAAFLEAWGNTPNKDNQRIYILPRARVSEIQDPKERAEAYERWKAVREEYTAATDGHCIVMFREWAKFLNRLSEEGE